ncbi:CvpA family protein [uncultured Desulfosarcina sp.]|uniref:CvpA family protein n=1 Tax=uncultured Desulfosarcina sp. TaxID=218289 RepID=UPI0029C9A8E3|nr:CvpA family protein [uncultured Desulfosarcina sp.]
MNMADAAILIFWLVCLIRGIFRGPVNELFSIAGVLAGLLVAAFSYPLVSRVLSGWIDSSPMRDLTCFLTIFGCMCLLMTVSGVIATYLLHLRRSGWINRTLGAGLGLLKAMLAVAVLLVPLVSFLPKHSTWISGSVIFPFENHLSEKMVHVLPSAIHEAFSSHIGDYKQSWRRNGGHSKAQ